MFINFSELAAKNSSATASAASAFFSASSDLRTFGVGEIHIQKNGAMIRVNNFLGLFRGIFFIDRRNSGGQNLVHETSSTTTAVSPGVPRKKFKRCNYEHWTYLPSRPRALFLVECGEIRNKIYIYAAHSSHDIFRLR